MKAAYHLTYELTIGNGPEKGKYPVTGGYTLSKDKAEAWKNERDGHDYEAIPITALQDALDLDKDERAEYLTWEWEYLSASSPKYPVSSSDIAAHVARQIGGPL